MELVNQKKCTGCMACVQACPVKSISIETDELGHLYPQIDTEKCIKCEKCQGVCPELNPCQYNEISDAYAVWSLDSENRKTSASGGAAAVFYEKALELGYLICGVEYQNDFHVMHILSNDKRKIEKFKQSKYVYSEMGDIYKEIKQQLQNGKKVLFISLPCKVAGLIKFLGEEKANLVTVDIVCHGTPSFQMLKDHINHICKGKESKKLSFRQDNEYVFSLKDGRDNSIYNKIGKADTYLAAFLEGLNYRKSCYQCSYARPERISDITICDFWGLGAEIPFEYPYSGAISAVLINTKCGKEYFTKCRNAFFVEKRTPNEAIRGNTQLNMPTITHPKVDEFEEIYKVEGFERAVEKCLKAEICFANKQNRKRKLRLNVRKLAGIFIKKYRG